MAENGKSRNLFKYLSITFVIMLQAYLFYNQQNCDQLLILKGLHLITESNSVQSSRGDIKFKIESYGPFENSIKNIEFKILEKNYTPITTFPKSQNLYSQSGKSRKHNYTNNENNDPERRIRDTIRIVNYKDTYQIKGFRETFNDEDKEYFEIIIDSTENCEYIYQLELEYKDQTFFHNRLKVISDKKSLSFQEEIPLEDVLTNVSDMKFFLNDINSANFFIEKYFLRRGGYIDESKIKRIGQENFKFLFTKKLQSAYIPVEQYLTEYVLPYDNVKVLQDSVAKFDPVSFKYKLPQFIIINDKIVLKDIGNSIGEVITDKDSLAYYREYYDRLYGEANLLGNIPEQDGFGAMSFSEFSNYSKLELYKTYGSFTAKFDEYTNYCYINPVEDYSTVSDCDFRLINEKKTGEIFIGPGSDKNTNGFIGLVAEAENRDKALAKFKSINYPASVSSNNTDVPVKENQIWIIKTPDGKTYKTLITSVKSDSTYIKINMISEKI